MIIGVTCAVMVAMVITGVLLGVKLHLDSTNEIVTVSNNVYYRNARMFRFFVYIGREQAFSDFSSYFAETFIQLHANSASALYSTKRTTLEIECRM